MPNGEPPSGVQVTYSRQYRRCGKATCTQCAAGGQGHGPYWYARWWADGQVRSRYIGKHLPPEPSLDGAGGGIALAAGASAVPLRVRTLGGFAVWRGDRPIPPEAWGSRRAGALFQCLLSTPGQRLPREQAIDLLWPEAEQAAGAVNLRTTLYLLRKVLGDARYLHIEGDLLVLAPAGTATPSGAWLDATAFTDAAHQALAGSDAATCRAALAGYAGEYLPDDPYVAWATQPRAALRQLHLDLLLHLAALCATSGELREAEECLRLVLATEPSHEGAAATLMAILAASGRRGEALQVYQQLAAVLEEDLEVLPNAELMALRSRLQDQQTVPAASSLPPRAGSTSRPTNLPLALTSFVGRVWEVQAVTEALEATRLLTLTGPGGVGKTRLALAVAESLLASYEDGVWLVELAALADPLLVPNTVAAALGVTEQAGRSLLETLAEFLCPRTLLLVLDNCEHLAAGCAELAAMLLRSCPQLRLLATSREGLEVAGEHTYRVPSLAVPDPAQLPPLEQLVANEAVRLFVERAQARRPEVELSATNAGAVVQICARLDGLPLAIELAAARVSALSIEAIAGRLHDRFRLLTGGPRTALPRQQTLRATLEWSAGLLDEAERVLWRRLAVFAGGWTLEAAEAVCTDAKEAAGTIGAVQIMDLLQGLVQKSLVLFELPVGDAAQGEPRYRMLETIRQYGLEKLEEAAELAEVRAKHLAWCISLSEQAEPHFRDGEQLVWLDRLEREHDNLRSALQLTTVEPEHAAAGVQLASALWRFWHLRDYFSEGRRWLAQTLAHGVAAPDNLRAHALLGAGQMAHEQGDEAQHLAYNEECLRIYRALGDSEGTARALVLSGWGLLASCDAMEAVGIEALALARQAHSPATVAEALTLLACAAMGKADLVRAAEYGEENLAISTALGDRRGQARALEFLGQTAQVVGDYKRAATLFDQYLTVFLELGSAYGEGVARNSIGETKFLLGDTRGALAELEQAIALFHAVGHQGHLIDALSLSGRITFQLGDTVRADALLQEALSCARTLGGGVIAFVLSTMGTVAYEQGKYLQTVSLQREGLPILRDAALMGAIPSSLEGLALALGSLGRAATAARLLGAASAARETFGAPRPPPDRAIYDRAVEELRADVGAPVWLAAWAEGRATELQAALSLALDVAGEVAAG